MGDGRHGILHAGTTYGAIGAVLGFASILSVTVSHLLGNGFDFIVLLGFVAFVGALVALVRAGIGPARLSGSTTSGAGAGALAGAFTGVGVMIGLLVDGTQNGTIPTPSGTAGALGYGVGVLVVLVGAATIFAVGGALLGALGGRIGRGAWLRSGAAPIGYVAPWASPGKQGQPLYPQYPGGPMGWPQYPQYPSGPSDARPYEGPPREPGR